MFCPNTGTLQAFHAPRLVVLSELGVTSDISCILACCFVRTWGCFGHFMHPGLLFCPNLGLLRTFHAPRLVVLSELGAASDISCILACCFVRTWDWFGHFMHPGLLFCPNLGLLRTFHAPRLVVLSELGVTSDISCTLACCFVRTWGYFRHFMHPGLLFCPNLGLLQTFHASWLVVLSELGVTSDISCTKACCFVRTWSCFGHFMHPGLLFCPNLGLLRTFHASWLVVLSELGVTSDISCILACCFVRTWGCFGHFMHPGLLFCPNLGLLWTFQPLQPVLLSELGTTSDISSNLACSFVRTWGCFGYFKRSGSSFCPNLEHVPHPTSYNRTK
jgi:hypothetical protein